MSLLSQFFPSSRGSTGADTSKGIAKDYSNQIPVDLIVIGGGGGGGGLPIGPLVPVANYCNMINTSMVTGGGGSGKISVFTNAFVNTGVVYPITVGAGGAVGSSGGTSCFGTIIAGGGGSGAGVDPAGNPVIGSASFSPLCYCIMNCGGGGGGAIQPVTCMTPNSWAGNSIWPVNGINSGTGGGNTFDCNQTGLYPIKLTTNYNAPGYIAHRWVGRCTSSWPCAIVGFSALSSGTGGRLYFPGTGCPRLSVDCACPVFCKWGLPNYIGCTCVGNSGSVMGYSSVNYYPCFSHIQTWAISPEYPAHSPLGAPYYYTIPSVPYTCDFTCGNRMISGIFRSSPFAPQAVGTPLYGQDWGRITVFTATRDLSVNVNYNQGPILVGCRCNPNSMFQTHGIAFNPVELTCIACQVPANLSNAVQYCLLPPSINNGSPGTGSGGANGLKVRPAVPITGGITYTFESPNPSPACPSQFWPGPYNVSFPGVCQSGGSGGSGSVWIIYPTDFAAATVTGNTPVPSPPSIRVYRWDGAGTIKFN